MLHMHMLHSLQHDQGHGTLKTFCMPCRIGRARYGSLAEAVKDMPYAAAVKSLQLKSMEEPKASTNLSKCTLHEQVMCLEHRHGCQPDQKPCCVRLSKTHRWVPKGADFKVCHPCASHAGHDT